MGWQGRSSIMSTEPCVKVFLRIMIPSFIPSDLEQNIYLVFDWFTNKGVIVMSFY
jgi:hypothetical protein